MLLLHAAKDNDIVRVDHAIREVQLPQGVLHEMLESCQHITQPKRHADHPSSKLVEPEVTHREGRVLL